MKVVTNSAEQTMALAQVIGSRLKGGECIELVSDVGGGKTTFARGLAKGAGSKSHVASPTFTISKVYDTPKFKIVHFDFYRLHEAGLIENEIDETVKDKHDVIVVEWSDIIKHVLPESRLIINIIVNADQTRTIEISFPPTLKHLTEEL